MLNPPLSTSKLPASMAREHAGSATNAAQENPRISYGRAVIRLNLKLEPPSLEREFWRSAPTRRALQLADTIACMLALVHVLAALKNFFKIQASTSMTHDYPAPFLWIYAASSTAYIATAGLPLLLMAVRPAAYQHFRYKLAVASRLVRAVNSTVVLLSSTAAAAIARALARRLLTQQHRPYVALLFNTVQPSVFFAQQAMFLVPWRWVLPLQLLNFFASLFWSARLPCALLLQEAAAGTLAGQLATAASSGTATLAAGTCASAVAASSTAAAAVDTATTSRLCAAEEGVPAPNTSSLFFQSEATSTCQLMHYVITLLGSTLGDFISFSSPTARTGVIHPNTSSSTGSYNVDNSGSTLHLATAQAPLICEGYLAVQTLQVFMSLFLFVLLPLVTIYWWEYTWKCRFLQSIGANCETPWAHSCARLLARLQAGTPSNSSSTSSSRSGSSSSSRLTNRQTDRTSSGTAEVTDSNNSVTYEVQYDGQPRCFLSSLCMLATLVLLAVYTAWSLATVIAWSIPHGLNCAAML